MKKYIFKHKGLFIITCIITIIYSIFEIISAYMFKYIIDLTTGKSVSSFLNGAIVLLVFCLASFFVDLIFPVVKAIYVRRTMIYMKEDIFSNILIKDVQDFNNEDKSKYISILNNDITMIENDGVLNLLTLIQYSFSFIFAVISLIYISVPITLVIFIVSLLTLIVPKKFSKNISGKKKDYSTSLELFTSKINNLLSGFEVIMTFNLRKKIKEIYCNSNTNVENKKFQYSKTMAIVNALSRFLGSLLFCIPLILGGYYVIQGKFTVGTEIAVLQLTGCIVTPLTAGIQCLNTLVALKPILAKVNDITKTKPIKQTKYKLDNFNSSIQCKNLCFSYNKTNHLLNNLNINFEKNKKYAIVGQSGSGKTTLVKLLLKYYDNYTGDICIDDKNIKEIDTKSLYDLISVIHQNIFIFDDTIKNNITLYKEVSDEKINDIINKTGLNKRVNSMKNGMCEYIGNGNTDLSGGEKQRLTIARALLKDSPIIILDEFTSSIDNETSFDIENFILNLQNKTIITITHKINKNILLRYDEILVLKDGYIIENGSFKELINKKGYLYELYNK